ncbi:Interference hedgehog [Frankliniella fusca]|uniref:Interference hedgehog n=1 Tax=Frankliniella fusca TaxID=407009 RepID=A0AAE1HJP3_9NEOP|nr:Interference hedgehog [Frankliniella fusca]
MWPEDSDADGAAGAGGWSSWRVSGEHLPLVVGGVAGGALIVMLVVAAVVWRLCVLRRDKQYRVRMGESAPETRPVQPVMPSESAVFASPVSGRWAYQSRLLGDGSGSPRGSSTPPAGLHSPSLGPSMGFAGTPLGTPHATPHATPPPQAWVYGDTIVAEARSASASASPAVHRSVSLQLAHQSPGSLAGGRRYPVGYSRAAGRPLSAVSSMGSYSAGCSPATPRHSAALPPPPPEFLLPDICEFNPGASCSSAQYASSSVLDEGGSLDGQDADGEALRTRSLPSSVRNKQRQRQGQGQAQGQDADDPDELYAKVNFSKKRKNRMRHDEAAIIAISKSRSQFLDKMAAEQDDDALVDNEAVIVYNERTAL